MSSLVADFAQLPLKDGDLWVTWIGCSEFIALVTYWDGLGGEVRNKVVTKASGNVAL